MFGKLAFAPNTAFEQSGDHRHRNSASNNSMKFARQNSNATQATRYCPRDPESWDKIVRKNDHNSHRARKGES
jgi:hypothetical protein